MQRSVPLTTALFDHKIDNRGMRNGFGRGKEGQT
jgi:hypothetical protein